MSFNVRLKEYRKRAKLTQEEIAKKLGIKRSTYAKYETGENQPDYKMLEKLADFFEVTTDDLLGRDNKKHDKEPYNSLKEINDFVRELGIDSVGFFNIDDWKNLDKEDVEEIKKHFEWVAHKAKTRKK
ncbi:helix-turn-helix domain-containing protein [Siminovitchia sediminis]|uniref:Helix-turn-helix domain-containing protein n=1 Tax=Siminovitchia sediminis TaxID=1274353 RepID=A0ABW4KI49_9BACI